MPRATTSPAKNRDPWIDGNGFLRVQIGAERQTGDQVDRPLSIASALTSDRPRPLIIDVVAFTLASPEAWVAFVERAPSMVTAIAFLTGEAPPINLYRIQEIVNSNLFPCRSFTNEQSAVAWPLSLEPRPQQS